jgi:hypothetical protein
MKLSLGPRGRIADAARRVSGVVLVMMTHRWLVLGYPSPEDSAIEMAIISSPSELTETLMLQPEGSLAVWGNWPPRANDGDDAITLDLVDADGVLRRHPH